MSISINNLQDLGIKYDLYDEKLDQSLKGKRKVLRFKQYSAMRPVGGPEKELKLQVKALG